MAQTTGTRKFLDLGGFPIDPEDHQALLEVKPNEIAIYLRLFNERGFIRRIVITNKVETLLTAWNTSNFLQPTTAQFALRLTDKVFDTFSQTQPSRPDEGIATTAIRVLCLYYLPELRELKAVPAENIVGVIFEYRNRRLVEYCYSQFSLDTPKSNVH